MLKDEFYGWLNVGEKLVSRLNITNFGRHSKYSLPELLLRWSNLEPADKTVVGISNWYITNSSTAVSPNEPLVKDQRTSPADYNQ